MANKKKKKCKALRLKKHRNMLLGTADLVMTAGVAGAVTSTARGLY